MKKYIFTLLLLIIILGTFLRFNQLDKDPLWFDETWSARLSQSETIDEVIITALEYDEHPIPQHIIFWYWAKLGTTEFILRSLSAITGVLSILFVFLVTKELFDSKTALISSFMFSVSPLLIQFSQEFRPYMLITFTALLSVYFFIKSLKTNKSIYWICYVIFTVLSANIEYLFVLLMIAMFLFVLVNWKKLRNCIWPWICSQIVIFFFVLPSLFTALYQMQGEMWSQLVLSPFWKVLIIPYNFFVFSFGYSNPFISHLTIHRGPIHLVSLIFLLILYACFFIDGILSSLKKKSKELMFVLFCLFIPILILYIINLFTYVQLEPKRFCFIVFAFYIILAKGISVLKAKWALAIPLVLILIISLISINLYYKTEKTDWPGITEYVANNTQDNDIVGISMNTLTIPFNYYYPGEPITIYGIPANYIKPTTDGILNHHFERYNYSEGIITKDNFQYLFNTTFKNHSRLWFIQSREKAYDPNDYFLSYLNEHYNFIENKNFSTVKVYLHNLEGLE